MKKRLLSSLILLALLVCSAAPAFAALTAPKVVPGRVLVGANVYAGGASGVGVEVELGLAPSLALATEVFPAYGDFNLNLRFALNSNVAIRGGMFSTGGYVHPTMGILASVPLSSTTSGIFNADLLVGADHIDVLMSLGARAVLSNGLGVKGGLLIFGGNPGSAALDLGVDYRF